MRFDPFAGGGQYYQDVLALSRHLIAGPLEHTLRELVEVRVSQITGCGYCLEFHSALARRKGVDQKKLDTVAGWREGTSFDDRERAALGLAEAMTRVGDGRRVEEPVWAAVRAQFNDEEIAALLYLIGLINVWNRINVAVELSSDHKITRPKSDT